MALSGNVSMYILLKHVSKKVLKLDAFIFEFSLQ